MKIAALPQGVQDAIQQILAPQPEQPGDDPLLIQAEREARLAQAVRLHAERARGGIAGQAPVQTYCIASTAGVLSPLGRNRPYQVGVRSCLLPHRNTYDPSPCFVSAAMTCS